MDQESKGQISNNSSYQLSHTYISKALLKKTLDSPLDCKEIQPVHPKGNQSWIFIGRTDAEAETPILGHLMRRTDSLKKTLMLGKIEGGRRRRRLGWDGWTAKLTRWTWVWASSGRWWRTGKPGVLQSVGSQRVGHDWETELSLAMELKKNFPASVPTVWPQFTSWIQWYLLFC